MRISRFSSSSFPEKKKEVCDVCDLPSFHDDAWNKKSLDRKGEAGFFRSIGWDSSSSLVSKKKA